MKNVQWKSLWLIIVYRLPVIRCTGIVLTVGILFRNVTAFVRFDLIWTKTHHHIISILESVFMYRGLGFLTNLYRRRPLHSERFRGSAVYISSFFLSLSITSSHDFLGLPNLFCATTFSLRTSAIQSVLRST